MVRMIKKNRHCAGRKKRERIARILRQQESGEPLNNDQSLTTPEITQVSATLSKTDEKQVDIDSNKRTAIVVAKATEAQQQEEITPKKMAKMIKKNRRGGRKKRERIARILQQQAIESTQSAESSDNQPLTKSRITQALTVLSKADEEQVDPNKRRPTVIKATEAWQQEEIT